MSYLPWHIQLEDLAMRGVPCCEPRRSCIQYHHLHGQLQFSVCTLSLRIMQEAVPTYASPT